MMIRFFLICAFLVACDSHEKKDSCEALEKRLLGIETSLEITQLNLKALLERFRVTPVDSDSDGDSSQ